MCRAVKVLCVATDDAALAALKRASVGAEWELAPGATDLRSALDQIDVERPHALVVFGPFDDLVALAAERFPGIRIVTDRDTPGASAVAGSPDDVRDLLAELPRPGGPVR
jgi:alkanesulfonate monooxygenase SsuD/methylene tetrahydromethanopterin reductase-like flavin-dependent oxidoreductase (luciferase family)